MVVGSSSFFYVDGANKDTADMDDTGVLTISDLTFSNANGWEMTFTDSNFGGATLLSSNFSLTSGGDVAWSFTGNTLTVDWLGTDSEGLHSVSFQMAAAVPEPETYAMLLAGLGLLGFVARRRKQKLATA